MEFFGDGKNLQFEKLASEITLLVTFTRSGASSRRRIS